MKTIADRFEIAHGAREEDGTKIDPEAQPVRRVLESAGTVNVGEGPDNATPINAQIPVSVSSEMTAEEAEALLATQCQFCGHWDPAAWEKGRLSIDPRDLDRMRAAALDCSSEEILTDQQRKSADPLLDCMGLCHALTEMVGEPLWAHPQATCPEQGPDGPLPLMFTPRDGAKKLRSHVRDRVMRAAQGRPLSK